MNAITTIEELKQKYIASQPQMAAGTIEQYNYAVKAFRAFLQREPLLDDFCDETLGEYIRHRLSLPRSPATVKRERKDLLVLWRWAAKRPRKWLEPPEEVPSIKVPERLPTAWSLDQFGLLLLACRKLKGKIKETEIKKCDWWESFLLFLYDTGTRLNAGLSVQIGQLDLVNRTAVLGAEYSKTNTEQLVTLSLQTCNVIGRFQEIERDFVWPWPYHRRTIQTTLTRILELAGLPSDRRRKFHCVRRTTATLTALHASLKVAQRQLGHTNMGMTLNRYIDPTIYRGSQAVDSLPRPNSEEDDEGLLRIVG